MHSGRCDKYGAKTLNLKYMEMEINRWAFFQGVEEKCVGSELKTQ